MRRYLPLLLISFCIILAVFASTFLASQAGRPHPDSIRTILVYTSLPVEQVAGLAQEYEKTAGIRVNVVPLAAADLLVKTKLEAASPRADVILAGAATLAAAKKDNLLAPHTSEQTDIIPDRFCDDDNFWVGLWYDPVVFAANSDYLKKLAQPPTAWADLATGGVRLAITDFLADAASANLLYTMAAAQGEDKTLGYLAKLHPKIVQYAKFPATPARMAGLGEADIAVTAGSEALRYIYDGFPLTLILPADGTAAALTGVALAARGPRAVDAAKFIDWLTTAAAQTSLARDRFHFVPANPELKPPAAYPAKDIKLFEYKAALTPDQRAKLLDKWVQTVRLSPR